MAIPLSIYNAIKDKYCIGYFGQDRELVSSLLKARKYIEDAYPGLQIFIACKNEMTDLVRGYKNIITESIMPNFKGKIAYFRNLEEKQDLINLLNESNINVDV